MFSSFRRFFHQCFVAITQVGIDRTRAQPISLIEKISLSNQISVVCSAFMLFYGILNLYLRHWEMASVYLIATAIISCSHYLNSKGNYWAARCLILAVGNFTIAISDIYLHFDGRAENFFITSAIATILLFELTDRKYLYAGVVAPLFFYFIPRFLNLNFDAYFSPLSQDQIVFFQHAHWLGSLGITVQIALLFAHSLVNYQKRLVHSNRLIALGEMSSGIAHEINNPLAIILGKSMGLRNRLKNGPLDLARIDYDLERIEKTSLRIAKIVKGLLSYSRSDEEDAFVQTSVDEIIDQSLELCLEKFQHEGIQVELPNSVNLLVLSRPFQISQAIVNLLNNSRDAIQGLDQRWIKLEVLKKNQRIHIAVTDSGNGILSHLTEKIMEPFFTTKEPGKGTGLGLSISKGIIESHGGQLILDQKNPRTRFVIDLPLAD